MDLFINDRLEEFSDSTEDFDFSSVVSKLFVFLVGITLSSVSITIFLFLGSFSPFVSILQSLFS